MRIHAITGLAVSLLLLTGSAASAAVDLEVGLRTSVRGSIAGPSETETFRFEATSGTVLKLAVAGKGMDLAISLEAPSGQAVSLTSAPGFRDTGSKVTLGGFTLDGTGTWILRITSATAGDYKLKLKGKPAKKAGGTFDVPGAGNETLTISAPAGSRVTLKAKAARGSAAEPRFGDFDGRDLTDEGRFSVKSHSVVVEGVAAGDHALVLENLGIEGGDIVVKVGIKAPKAAPFKLDVRDDTLGSTSGGGTALSRRLDDMTGGELEIDDENSPIDGTTVRVGAGALAEETTISITSAAGLTPPPDRQSAGPTVEFGPAGLTFAAPVEVTLPYDPARLPPDASAADLRVIHAKENGVTETLVPTDVDEVNHRLTVETSSFSKFMPSAPKGPPSLAGRSYWGMFLDFEFVKSDDDDSRVRHVYSATSVLSFAAEDKGTWSTREDEYVVTHSAMTGSTLEHSQTSDSGGFGWNYDPDGKSIHMSGGDGESIELAFGPSGAVLATSDASSKGTSSLQLLIEKPKTTPTLASLAGDFWLLQFGLEVSEDAPGALTFRTYRAFGSATLEKDGTITDSATQRFCEFGPSTGGAIFCDKESWNDGGTTWKIAGPESGIFEDAIVASWTDEGVPQSAFLLPSADGNIFFSVNGPTMIVGVRKGSGLSPAAVAGSYGVRGLDLELTTYESGLGPVGDVYIGTVDGTLTIQAKGTVGFNVSDSTIERDPSVPGGVRFTVEIDAGSTGISVGKTGDVTIDSGGDDTVGALTPDGSFGFVHDSPNTDHGIVGIIFLLRSP